MAVRRILVQTKIGAITAFAQINNLLYGVTAGHVLTGVDNHIDRNEMVAVFDDDIIKWIDAGQPVAIHYTVGADLIPDNFGTLDAGIFSLMADFKDHITARLKKIPIHPFIINRDFKSLVGLRVYSFSVMYNRVIAGTVAEIFSESSPGNHYDLIIDSDDNEIITTHGDSGILWYDVKGFAIGLHTNGNADESTASYSTLINRVMNIFQIQELYLL